MSSSFSKISASPTCYDSQFFQSISDGSLQSARVVAPLVCQLADIKSVVDVGCGTGAWLFGFGECGITELTGYDGDYVDRRQLLIEPSQFVESNLETLAELPTGFDLAICLEVVEHLSDAAGRRIVTLLTKAAPLVLFSAAVPGQGGTHHINERSHAYWHQHFEALGFRVIDGLRPQIFADESVAPWYRQNIFLYANEEALTRWPELCALSRRPVPTVVPMSARLAGEFTTIRGLARHLVHRIRQRLFG